MLIFSFNNVVKLKLEFLFYLLGLFLKDLYFNKY